MNFDTRLIELFAELRVILWKIIFISETRRNTQDIFIQGGHRLVSSHGFMESVPASGIEILIHCSLIPYIRRKLCLHNRLMALDLKIGAKTIRVICVYAPHSGYPEDEFRSTMEDLSNLVTELRASVIVSSVAVILILLSGWSLVEISFENYASVMN